MFQKFCTSTHATCLWTMGFQITMRDSTSVGIAKRTRAPRILHPWSKALPSKWVADDFDCRWQEKCQRNNDRLCSASSMPSRAGKWPPPNPENSFVCMAPVLIRPWFSFASGTSKKNGGKIMENKRVQPFMLQIGRKLLSQPKLDVLLIKTLYINIYTRKTYAFSIVIIFSFRRNMVSFRAMFVDVVVNCQTCLRTG